MESPVQAEERYSRENRDATQSREANRKRVGKSVSQLPRKAAIAYMMPVPETDTGG